MQKLSALPKVITWKDEELEFKPGILSAEVQYFISLLGIDIS